MRPGDDEVASCSAISTIFPIFQISRNRFKEYRQYVKQLYHNRNTFSYDIFRSDSTLTQAVNSSLNPASLRATR